MFVVYVLFVIDIANVLVIPSFPPSFTPRDEVGAMNICKRLLVDSGLMAADCLPYFLQRAAPRRGRWRMNNSHVYSVELRSPVGNILSTKQQKKNKAAKRKAHRMRKKNRQARERNNL